MTRSMLFLCRINKDINIHSEYVIIIVFPRHQLLHERLSYLRLYVNWPVLFDFTWASKLRFEILSVVNTKKTVH